MNQFRFIFTREFQKSISNRLSLFYILIFVGGAIFLYAGTLGLFDPHSTGGEGIKWLNSPSSINEILLSYSKFMLLLVPPIVAGSLHRDFSSGFHSLLYSYPMNKRTYNGAKFMASFLVLAIIAVVVTWGFMLAEQLPGINTALIGSFKPKAYLHTLLIYILPNFLIAALFAYSAVMLSRNIYAAYVSVFFIILFQTIGTSFFTGNEWLTSLSDPLGQSISGIIYKDWNITAMNNDYLPVTFMVLANRLLWIGIGLLIFLGALYRFQFHETGPELFLSSIRKSRGSRKRKYDVGAVQYRYGLRYLISATGAITRKSCAQLFYSPLIWVCMFSGLSAAFFILFRIVNKDDFLIEPATQVMISTPFKVYAIIIVLSTFVLSGNLLQREKASKMDPLMAVVPLPKATFVLGKLVAITIIQYTFLILYIVLGISIQWYFGFDDLRLRLYLHHLLFVSFIPLLSWTILSLSIHLLIRNLFLAIFLLFLIWIGAQGLAQSGLDSYLIRFNQLPELIYSDINQYGHSGFGYWLVAAYWLSLSFLVLLASIFLWNRWRMISLKDQFFQSLNALDLRSAVFFSLVTVGALFLGYLIYQDEKQLSKRVDSVAFDQLIADFEPFEHLNQPKITSLNAVIDIDSKHQNFSCTGFYWLKNISPSPIDTLILKTGYDEITELYTEKEYTVLKENSEFKVKLLRLNKPLEPLDSLKLSFKIRNRSNSLLEKNSNVLSNGTFIRQDIFPRIGYQFRKTMPLPKQADATLSYYAIDANKIDLKLTVVTSADEWAVAPGYLISQWLKDDRAHYVFESPFPVKFSFGIVVGSYPRSDTVIQDRVISTYSAHHRAISSITEGVVEAITFNEEYFSDYPYDTIRIVEFPKTEGTFATAYGNMLAISEARFLSRKAHGTPDLAFYVAAHEMTHHWWGNQLIPAYSKGATMLTESITEFLMLVLLESTKGKTEKERFYELQQERYAKGARIQPDSVPLVFAEPRDQYLTYGKGATRFYDLSEIVGRKNFLILLCEFMNLYAVHDNYPTSLDFTTWLKSRVDEEAKDFIEKNIEN